jgi:hypothetical protein
MTTRTLVLATLVLCGSAVAYAAEPTDVHKSRKSAKNADKDKDRVPVSVPDGDPSTALMLTVGVGTAIAWALAVARRGTTTRRQ